MKSPDQLKNDFKKIVLPATAVAAGLFALAGCGDSQETQSESQSMGPVTEVTATAIYVPPEPKDMQIRPYFPPQPEDKHCVHYDVSPTELPGDHRSESVTIDPPVDTRGLFGDSYQTEFKGFSADAGFIRVTQRTSNGEKVSVSNFDTSNLGALSAKYVQLEDTVENGATVGFLVDSAETPDQRAEVWTQICTEMEIPQAPASQGQAANSTAA